jgi:hypothetical protein
MLKGSRKEKSREADIEVTRLFFFLPKAMRSASVRKEKMLMRDKPQNCTYYNKRRKMSVRKKTTLKIGSVTTR